MWLCILPWRCFLRCFLFCSLVAFCGYAKHLIILYVWYEFSFYLTFLHVFGIPIEASKTNKNTKSCLFCGLVGGDTARHILSAWDLVLHSFKLSALCGWRVPCCTNRWQSMIFERITDTQDHVLAFAIFPSLLLSYITLWGPAMNMIVSASLKMALFVFLPLAFDIGRATPSFSSFVCQDIVQPLRERGKRLSPKSTM